MKKRKGFSLIEILVAMTILTVIVLVVSAIFQQTSIAWSVGLRRADAQSSVRAVVGALSRDFAGLVDPTNFVCGPAQADESVRQDALGEAALDEATGDLGGGSLDFWVLRPADISTVSLTDTSIAGRELVHVHYSLSGGSVTREETSFDANGENPSSSTTTRFDLGDGGITVSRLSGTDYDGYTSLYDDAGIELRIRPAKPIDVNDYEIAVGSCGPDRRWGTDDDIRPWVKSEE